MTGPGYLPGAIAVSWLRVHQIWDNNKGRLPSSIVSLVDDALVDWYGAEAQRGTTVHDAETGGEGASLLPASLSRFLDRVDDAVDSTMLLWLTAVVAVVVSKLLLGRQQFVV